MMHDALKSSFWDVDVDEQSTTVANRIGARIASLHLFVTTSPRLGSRHLPRKKS